jgi:hypothetical protein
VLNLFYQEQERNPFLLWKIRTILHSKQWRAQEIPTFTQCCPQLQATLTGTSQWLAGFALTPLEWATHFYWKLKKN